MSLANIDLIPITYRRLLRRELPYLSDHKKIEGALNFADAAFDKGGEAGRFASLAVYHQVSLEYLYNVVELDRFHICCLMPEEDLKFKEIDVDRASYAHVADKASEFWDTPEKADLISKCRMFNKNRNRILHRIFSTDATQRSMILNESRAHFYEIHEIYIRLVDWYFLRFKDFARDAIGTVCDLMTEELGRVYTEEELAADLSLPLGKIQLHANTRA